MSFKEHSLIGLTLPLSTSTAFALLLVFRASAWRLVQPGNIFVKNGQYKLGDFGLVTPVHVRSGTDVVEGDSRYMSKELLNDDLSNLTKVFFACSSSPV